MSTAPIETDILSEFRWARPDEVERLMAEGWRPCKGWQNAEHHLRYTLPMERDTKVPA